MICRRRVPCDDKPCHHYIRAEASGEAGFCALPTEFRCIEAVKHFSPRLSFSAANDWTQCRYKYYLRNIKGVQRHDYMKSVPLKMGSIWDGLWNAMVLSGEINKEVLYSMIESKAEELQLEEKNIYILKTI